jgi:hypothetical protein
VVMVWLAFGGNTTSIATRTTGAATGTATFAIAGLLFPAILPSRSASRISTSDPGAPALSSSLYLIKGAWVLDGVTIIERVRDDVDRFGSDGCGLEVRKGSENSRIYTWPAFPSFSLPGPHHARRKTITRESGQSSANISGSD